MARTLCDLWLLLKSRCALWFLFAIAALVLWNDWWKSPWRCRLPVLFFVSVFAFVLWKLISLPELQIRQGTLCTRFWHEQMPRAWPILLFFTALVGTIEFARVLYIRNTLQEVTRTAARAAAVSSFAQREQIKRDSLFHAGATDAPVTG